MESAAQLLRCQAQDNDTRYPKQTSKSASVLFVICHENNNCIYLVLVLHGIDDASCAGLKNLLLGAISGCLNNTNDAIQVASVKCIL